MTTTHFKTRTHFKRRTGATMVLPIALSIGAAVAVLLVSLFVSAREMDARSLASERVLLTHALLQRGEGLARELKVQTVWAEGYTNAKAANVQWMHEFYGPYLDRLLGYKRVYVIANDTPLYAYIDGGDERAQAYDEIRGEIKDLVSAVRGARGEFRDYPVIQSLVRLDDGTTIEHRAIADVRSIGGMPAHVIVTTIVPDVLPDEPVKAGALLMIAVAPLDRGFVERLGNQFDFEGLAWAGEHDDTPALATLDVMSRAGTRIGTLRWSPEAPGFALLKSLAPGLGLALLLLVAFAVTLVKRSLDQSRLINAHATELAFLNAGLELRVMDRTHQLEGTLANISQGIVMLGADGTVLVSNSRASELLDVADERALASSLTSLLGALQTTASGREQRTKSSRMDCKLPSGRILEIARAKLVTGEQVVTIADVTPLKKRQAELEAAKLLAETANRTKSQFLSTMSHEMRTPLNGVIGALDLLTRTPLAADQRDLVDTAIVSGEALLVHISDVLDFSKMEAGKLDLVLAPFDMHRLVEGVQRIVEPQAAQRATRLVAKLDTSVPQVVVADAMRVRQILLNLAGNAAKFTHNGLVAISATRVGGSDAAPEIEFSVKDTGPGIPADRMASMFQEFSMLDASYARREGGTGLGLAISKRLVSAMGGTIGVESEVGKGSRFWFRLALERGEAIREEKPLEVVAAQTAEAETAPAKPLTVLLVDDSSVNRMIGTQMLTSMGHKVETATNGLEAVAAAMTTRYDVILMDISMPELDGMEASKRIRGLAEPYVSVPIVALTANAVQGDRERFLDAGMNDYLTKPYRRADIEAVIAKLLGGARQAA